MLHVKDTVFRMLPNPTVFYWDPNTFSLPNLLSEYITSLRLFREKHMAGSEQIKSILDWAETDQKFPLLRAEGSTLDVFGEDINGATLVNSLNHLRAGIELCDDFFAKMKKPSLSLVKKVTRTHIQEVMSILHEKNEKDDRTTNEATNDAMNNASITIHDIDSAPADERESLLMQMYYDRVRPNVARIIGQQTLLSKHMRERRDSVPSDNGSNIASPRSAKMFTTSDEVNEIWCVLVFRMLCWLQLYLLLV